jgi:hypothetical protein
MEQRNTVAKGSSSAPMFKLFPIPRFFGEEVQARAASFIGQDFRVARREWSSIAKCRYSRPTPAAVYLAVAITGDAVADLLEKAGLLDIDADHAAGMLTLLAAHRGRAIR